MGLAFTRPRQLEDGERLDDFHCGAELIDDWVRMKAPKARTLGTAVVYVSYESCGAATGFYALSAHSISRAVGFPGWLKRNTQDAIPVILLGMLAVDSRYQGCGLGKMLLSDALKRACFVAGQIGAKALVVDPLDESAASFYERFGFTKLPESKRMAVKLSPSLPRGSV